MNESKQKIVLFWVLVMVGIVVHCIGDILPIFWGVDIAVDNLQEAPASMVIIMMVVCYVLPLAGILCTIYGKGRCWAVTNFVLASAMTLFNLAHCSELFMMFSYGKLFSLPFVLLVSLLLAYESWRVLKAEGSCCR